MLTRRLNDRSSPRDSHPRLRGALLPLLLVFACGDTEFEDLQSLDASGSETAEVDAEFRIVIGDSCSDSNHANGNPHFATPGDNTSECHGINLTNAHGECDGEIDDEFWGVHCDSSRCWAYCTHSVHTGGQQCEVPKSGSNKALYASRHSISCGSGILPCQY